MRAQLARLVEAVALPAVTLQVLPFSAGAYPAMSGCFTLLGYGDLGMPDLAYVEHPLGSVRIDKAAEVDRATLAFERLRWLAPTPDDSVALIERVRPGDRRTGRLPDL